MVLRSRLLRQVFDFLPPISSGYHHPHHSQVIKSLGFSSVPYHFTEEINRRTIADHKCPSRWFSTKSALSRRSPTENDLLSFIKSSFNKLEGPYHCWLNTCGGNQGLFKQDGTFLVVAGQFLETTGSKSVILFEKVKLLQQRFPHLHVIGFQYSGSVSASHRSDIILFIAKEYISFPILLSKKNFEIGDGLTYILFKDFKNPVLYHEKDLDLGILKTAVEELHVQNNGNSGLFDHRKSAYMKQAEIIKEPCSLMQNFLLHFPGSISADESSNRLFLSDSNHHRIIIFDGNGKIIDCIGSYPGFEDGEFESARLSRPAASYYHDAEDCLYFVDSENHAIRRADFGRRVLETLYPASYSAKKNKGIWAWILNKLGRESHDDKKTEEFGSGSLVFPWHVIKSDDDKFLILNRSLTILWIMDLASGEIKEIIEGLPKIVEICGHLIMEKVALLKQIPHIWLHQQMDTNSVEGLQYAALVSSMTTFQDHIIICDTVGQGVLKVSRESGDCSDLRFSNFGILGLPYWLTLPLESVFSSFDGFLGAMVDHSQSFALLPGRINIRINIKLPVDTELVEPLQEGCIWCQTRGAATEVSFLEDSTGPPEKVGVSQQWYDELDNLAFSAPESEPIVEDENSRILDQTRNDNVHIDCAVNSSPGTSEVIINAALYLKLRSNQNMQEGNQEKFAERIADILHSKSSRKIGRDACIQLLKSKRDLRDLIFVKPLHVRVKMDSLAHPKADNSRDVVLTESSIEVDVSLSS